ncbi:MAG TPA: MBOAT family O-acyltransferase, partial [Vicinamibacterales bacterium]|nr:MBOAT family O-acyltransferase [Vicinamibacterales bacterium]
MIFHSLDFLVFFLLVVAAYWALGHRAQNVLLLAASYFFYGYVHPWFLILIGTSTVIDYASARGMERRPDRRRWFMAASIVSNFGMLGFFKYFNFFLDNVHAVLAAAGADVALPTLRVLLPVGISFYTFQAMSYTVDVFRGELRARRSLLDVAVFISFFPHLVAGPIQRASFLLPQVEGERRFSIEKASSGFTLMVWGFFKKLVIADNVGVIANKVFALSDPSFDVLWAGVFAFAIQIYADFSAYTDIARGSSRWLGFELTENFDHPYLARTPADFWRRWNISLSTWFRDYVYIPLGGSREGGWKWARNVMATFLLSGLWHGASWNYVLWGGYHGLLLVLTRTRRIVAPAGAT